MARITNQRSEIKEFILVPSSIYQELIENKSVPSAFSKKTDESPSSDTEANTATTDKTKATENILHKHSADTPNKEETDIPKHIETDTANEKETEQTKNGESQVMQQPDQMPKKIKRKGGISLLERRKRLRELWIEL